MTKRSDSPGLRGKDKQQDERRVQGSKVKGADGRELNENSAAAEARDEEQAARQGSGQPAGGE